MHYDGWPPYVPVAARRAAAARVVARLRKKGRNIEPIEIQGRKIARSFWGESWCSHLERFSDFANRLPRGRTYVRNGSVCHLGIDRGSVEAMVSGSSLYEVAIDIAPLPPVRWKNIRKKCAGQIGSMLELLQGQMSGNTLKIVTDETEGLFPQRGEMKFRCSCPDWAILCKHVAAALYGVGARLDKQPELLFRLRKVDHRQLLSTNPDLRAATAGRGKRRRLESQDLSGVFGVNIDDDIRTAPVKRGKSSMRKTTQRAHSGKFPKRQAVRRGTKRLPENAEEKQKRRIFSPTGAAVVRLRKRYGTTRSEFANMLGVSAQTVANWEAQSGPLKLQQRTLAALTRAWSRA